MADMSTAEINDLPDSDFAYIEPGGEKDAEGKTTPRSLRHYPVHDEAHARNALSRASAAIKGDNAGAKGIAEKAMPKILAACKKFGIEVSDESKAADKPCPTCDGSGKIMEGNRDCPDCGGTGVMDSESKSAPVVVHERAIREEYRGTREERVAPQSQFELREVPNGTGGTNLRFTGFASVTGDNASYEMEDFLGPWTESITPGAFQKTLSQGADVAFLLNHAGMTLARTKPGTLKLSEETNPQASPVYGVTGLHSQADLDPQNMYVQAMRSAVDRGDLDEMSFAFRVIRQEWNEPTWDRRRITECSLDKGDVSLVNYGANPHTGGTVSLRQRFGVRDHGDRVAAMLTRMDPAELGVMLKRPMVGLDDELRVGKVLSGDNEAGLQQALDHLHSCDDADLPGIVRSLQDINSALDAGQACIAAVLKVANPDGDPKDLQPALVPPDAKDAPMSGGTHSYSDDDDEMERRVVVARQKGLAA